MIVPKKPTPAPRRGTKVPPVVGDVVIAPKHLPRMTVAEIDEDGLAFCQWFEGTTLKAGVYPIGKLTKVDA